VEIHAPSVTSSSHVEKHPKGTQARILLSSVFGPYARDDEFGSRSINPMELYHNQVTARRAAFRCACSIAPGALC